MVSHSYLYLVGNATSSVSVNYLPLSQKLILLLCVYGAHKGTALWRDSGFTSDVVLMKLLRTR